MQKKRRLENLITALNLKTSFQKLAPNTHQIIANMSNLVKFRKNQMKTLPSVEVQNKFGSIANIVKSGEPVAVTQYGTPTMMILPYALAVEALREYKARRMVDFMDQMKPAAANHPALTDEQISELVHELRP